MPAYHCQHPFGEGIHVVIPRGQVLIDLLQSMESVVDVGRTVIALLGKIPKGGGGKMVAIYTGQPPENFAAVYLVLRLAIAPAKQKVSYDAVALFADPGFEEAARSAARGFQEAFKD